MCKKLYIQLSESLQVNEIIWTTKKQNKHVITKHFVSIIKWVDKLEASRIYQMGNSFYFINIVYHVDLFVHVELFLQTKDKFHLVMVYNPLMDCWIHFAGILLRFFTSMLIRDFGL